MHFNAHRYHSHTLTPRQEQVKKGHAGTAGTEKNPSCNQTMRCLILDSSLLLLFELQRQPEEMTSFGLKLQPKDKIGDKKLRTENKIFQQLNLIINFWTYLSWKWNGSRRMLSFCGFLLLFLFGCCVLFFSQATNYAGLNLIWSLWLFKARSLRVLCQNLCFPAISALCIFLLVALGFYVVVWSSSTKVIFCFYFVFLVSSSLFFYKPLI